MRTCIPAYLLSALLLCHFLSSLPTLQAQERVEEVLVVGRQPGPPLWRVTSGANSLWILPLVSVVPQDMVWDDARVAQLIMAADEAITLPNANLGVSKRVLLNPLNLVRGYRLLKRLSHNPGDATLAEVLPPDVHARYAALKADHFPKDRRIDQLRPAFAASEVRREVLDHEHLAGYGVIVRQVNKLLRKNRQLLHTEISQQQILQGSYRDLSQRIETLLRDLPQEQELACFDLQLSQLQQDLDDMKQAANAWASGSARDMENFLPAERSEDPCSTLWLGSSEGELLEQVLQASRQRWLDTAAMALARSRSTFAMLPLNEITGEQALVKQLAAQGYVVHAPL